MTPGPLQTHFFPARYARGGALLRASARYARRGHPNPYVSSLSRHARPPPPRRAARPNRQPRRESRAVATACATADTRERAESRVRLRVSGPHKIKKNKLSIYITSTLKNVSIDGNCAVCQVHEPTPHGAPCWLCCMLLRRPQGGGWSPPGGPRRWGAAGAPRCRRGRRYGSRKRRHRS